ncbi:MAG: 5-bromo-4-chloroindolyl phosphate hydrolysis family protein [Lutimaribacter sp.]
MAKRFGGQYSPGAPANSPGTTADTGYAQARRSPVGARVNLLFFWPVLLLAKSYFGPPTQFLTTLVGAMMLVLAAWLTREGVRAHAAYEARKVARRPAIPRKIFAAILTGLGLGLAGYAAFGLAGAVVVGLLGAGLHSMAFGLDPLRNKGFDEVGAFQAQRAGDPEVQAQLRRFQAVVAQMLQTVQDDPRDLSAARKYLGVYLMGARDAAQKFADLHQRNPDGQAKPDFLQLLADLEAGFGAKTQKLLLADHADLTVEIEVLRARLQREGVRVE